MKKRIFLVCLFALFALGSTAHAVMLTGDIAFGSWGKYTLTGGTTFADNTGFDFFAGPNSFVSDATGDFASFAPPAVTLVQFNDFEFTPFTSGTTLWSFSAGGNNYSLIMNSLFIVKRDIDYVVLRGTATLMGVPGFDPTPGTFLFQAGVAQLGVGEGAFAFSSNAGAVPEPATMLLLGSGLIGLAGFRKRFKK